MRAGKLNRRITLQTPAETRGGTYDDPQITWSDVATVWAAVAPLSGREFMQNREVHAQLDHRITIRYLPGVTTKMRVTYGARTFEIDAVLDLEEAGRELQLMCREMDSAG